MSQYLPQLYEPFGGDINIKVNFFNYATKLDLKNATGLDTYKLTTKSELASLKAEVDKIDVGKLKTLPTDLSKLSYVVKNEVIKKTVDTKHETDKSDLEKKINDVDKKVSDTSGLIKK